VVGTRSPRLAFERIKERIKGEDKRCHADKRQIKGVRNLFKLEKVPDTFFLTTFFLTPFSPRPPFSPPGRKQDRRGALPRQAPFPEPLVLDR
jgi:hypothetical protein